MAHRPAPEGNTIRDYSNTGQREEAQEPWLWWPVEKFVEWLEEREEERRLAHVADPTD